MRGADHGSSGVWAPDSAVAHAEPSPVRSRQTFNASRFLRSPNARHQTVAAHNSPEWWARSRFQNTTWTGTNDGVLVPSPS